METGYQAGDGTPAFGEPECVGMQYPKVKGFQAFFGPL
jgi:hypothetical protein